MENSEIIFCYNSSLSFGLGADHLSVSKTANGSFFIQNGTPMHKGKPRYIHLSSTQEAELRALNPYEGEDLAIAKYTILHPYL